MKLYPSIDGKIVDVTIHAFDKADGQNIRAEFSKKAGLHKFGSRKVLLGEDHPIMGRAIKLTHDKYGDALGRIFAKERIPEATCYFEFHGERSFAGQHDLVDPTLTVTLIDVSIFKRGFPVASEFLKMFDGKVEIPRMLHHGKPNRDFIESVKNRTLDGMTYEGVVCKGQPLKKGFQPLMFKIKSLDWIARVKERYAGDAAMLADIL